MIICKLYLNCILQNTYLCSNKKFSKKMKKALFLILILSSFINIWANNFSSNNKSNDSDKIIINENRFDKLIYLAESYIKTSPEFAFNCAHKANTIARNNNDIKQEAESYILIGDIFNRGNTYSTAINYYEKAIEKLINIKEYQSIYELYRKIAIIYKEHESESKWSIDAMKNALIYAQTIKSQSTIIETYLDFADLYVFHKNYHNAMEYYNKVLKYDRNDKNIRSIARALTSKAYILIKERNYPTAMQLLDSSLNICNTENYQLLEVINNGYKAEISDSIKDYANAKNYYKKAIDLSYKYEEFDECGEYMYKLGKLNMKLDSISPAIEVFKILCDSTEKFKMFDICYISYYEMSKCYANIGDYKEAYRLFNKYDECYDSAKLARQEKELEEIHTGYLLSLNIEEFKANELKSSNSKNQRINSIISITAVLVIIILCISLIVLFSRNKSLYNKNIQTTYEQQIKINKMENDLMEIQLKNNKESLINLALHLKSYIDFINPLKNELKEIIELPEEEQKIKIKGIYSNIQNNTRLFNNTENLNKQIDDIYKDFLERLEEKYPSITKAEKRLCAMLYINMSTKEIAVITNTTLRSVETSRYRLRKKFNLSRDEDMINFLRNI